MNLTQRERIDAFYKDPFGNDYNLSSLRNIAARLREVRNGDSVVMEHLFPARSPDLFADTDHSCSVAHRRHYKSELPRIEKRISELESEKEGGSDK